MRIKQTLIICFLICLLFASLGTASVETVGIETPSYDQVQEVDAAPGVETQITTSEVVTVHYCPAIYGDKIVWYNSTHETGADICMYDISTSTTSGISTYGSDEYDPAIYEGRIIWTDSRHGYTEIYMYNLSTSTESRVTHFGSSKMGPDIHKDRIVWSDMRNGNWDIYMYDLETSTETRITTNESHQSYPSIYGDRIVWTDSRHGDYCVYMYDISTCKETRITSTYSLGPAIYEDKIVWADMRNENADIYLYNISTCKEYQITTDEYNQGAPAIYGDIIVWMDYRWKWPGAYQDSDIYMYDLSASKEMSVVTEGSDQFDVDIYDNRIVWVDNRDGYQQHYNIYMFTLDTPGEELGATDSVEELKNLNDYVNSLNLHPSAANVFDARLKSAISYINKGDEDKALKKLESLIECVYSMQEKGRVESTEAEYIVSETRRIIYLISNC